MALQAAEMRADETATRKTHERFTFKLTDGSSIVCKPKLESLPFKTAFAEMNIPLEKVETLKIDHKGNVAALSLLNGDRLQGRCLLEDIIVESILGDLRISLVHIAEISTTLKKEPVFKDTPARRNACINNLRMLDAAKEQWALATGQNEGATVNVREVNEYIRGNTTPTCPAGGTYTYNTIGADPQCSVPGHALSW